MSRWAWTLLAAVLLLAGYYANLQGLADWVAFLLLGVGAGIICAVVGSLLHDSLAGPIRPR